MKPSISESERAKRQAAIAFARNCMCLTDVALGDAREVLDQRYIAGELTHEEYSQLCSESIERGVSDFLRARRPHAMLNKASNRNL